MCIIGHKYSTELYWEMHIAMFYNWAITHMELKFEFSTLAIKDNN